MKSISGKELAKLLESHGWILLRVQGSHHIYGKSGVASRISIPIQGNKDIKIGLLRNLLKTAGLLETMFSEKSVEQLPDETDRKAEKEDDLDNI